MAKPYVTSIERMGRKEGLKEGSLRLAWRMLEAGYPLEEVLKLTELSAEELSTAGVKLRAEDADEVGR